MIRCCIFDLDGTILDTLATLTHFVNITLQKHGIPTITEDECRRFVGDGARNLIDRALRSKGISDEEKREELLSQFVSAYNEDYFYLTKPFDGICDLLRKLKERGFFLAVLTNKPDTTARSIIKHFFGDIFDTVYGARAGIPLKPDPTAATEILKELSTNASETAWIGDSAVDIETGKNLGVALTVGVPWGFRDEDELRAYGADVIASSAEEIFVAVTSYD